VTSGLLPRSEPYNRRLEAMLLLFIVTYAINKYKTQFNLNNKRFKQNGKQQRYKKNDVSAV